ncbi:hypothetical protein QJS77_12565 [Enterococcus faecium]|uniref:hypothetical protein n=1 Tax=Enterococcus faecium TaxID=1352 RepID=UPI00396E86B1
MASTPSDNKLKKYIHIGIHYHANNYYRKKRNYSTRLLLTDFQDIMLDSSYTDNYFNITNMPLLDLKNLETYFEDEMLMKAIKQLNIKEKRFLLEKYVIKKVILNLHKKRKYHSRQFLFTRKGY